MYRQTDGRTQHCRISDRLLSLLSAIDAVRCDFTCRMTEKERSAVAEATGNVSTRAKHSITSGNAVGISNSFCYLHLNSVHRRRLTYGKVRLKLPWQNWGGWARFGACAPWPQRRTATNYVPYWKYSLPTRFENPIIGNYFLRSRKLKIFATHNNTITRKPSYRWQTRATRNPAKNCSNSTCLQRCRW